MDRFKRDKADLPETGHRTVRLALVQVGVWLVSPAVMSLGNAVRGRRVIARVSAGLASLPGRGCWWCRLAVAGWRAWFARERVAEVGGGWAFPGRAGAFRFRRGAPSAPGHRHGPGIRHAGPRVAREWLGRSRRWRLGVPVPVASLSRWRPWSRGRGPGIARVRRVSDRGGAHFLNPFQIGRQFGYFRFGLPENPVRKGHSKALTIFG